jgi:ABC-type nitrate/sulfonate/bicarbonate transport system ATPase subunit
VVMVTHDPLEAARLADEVVVLQGTPAEIVKTLRCPVSQGVRPVSSDVLHQVHEQLLEHLLATP